MADEDSEKMYCTNCRKQSEVEHFDTLPALGDHPAVQRFCCVRCKATCGVKVETQQVQRANITEQRYF